MILNVFAYACWLFMDHPWKNACSAFCPFFKLVGLFLLLHYKSFLYTLDVNPLIFQGIIASHSVGCLFTLLIVFNKRFSFWCNQFIFFCSLCFCVISKKSVSKLMLWSFSSVFSSKSFIVLDSAFRSLIHFWAYFCTWCMVRATILFKEFFSTYQVLVKVYVSQLSK